MWSWGRLLLSVLFVVAGALHFINPRFYLRMMPDWLPLHDAAVYLSGLAEIALGLGLWTSASQWAAWGLFALLIAVFPANLNMALHPEEWPKIVPAMLWGRLPLQGALLYWVWRFTR